MKRVKNFTNSELARELEYIPPYLTDAARKYTTSEESLNEAAERLRSTVLVRDDGCYAGKCARLEKMLKDERRENATLQKALKVATEGLRKMGKDQRVLSDALYKAVNQAKQVGLEWAIAQSRATKASGKRIGIH